MKPKKAPDIILQKKRTSRPGPLSKKDRLKGVLLVLKKGYTPRQAAQIIGCPVESMERSIQRFQTRRQAVQPIRTNLSILDWLNREETLSEKTREKAVKLHLFKGYSRRRIAKKIGCTEAALSKWIAELSGRLKAENPKLPAFRVGKAGARLTEKEKKKAVKRALFSSASIHKIAQQIGVSPSSVRYWIERYADEIRAENSALPNLLFEKTQERYPEETKKDAVKQIIFGGASVSQTAQEVGSSISTIRNWLERYTDQVKAENPDISPVNLRMPNPSYPVQERMRAVEMLLYEGVPYEEITNKFGCSTATLYNWTRAYSQQVMAANPGRKLNRYNKTRRSPDGTAPSEQGNSANPPRMTKEERKNIVKLVINDGYTYRKAAQAAGCTEQTVNYWIKRFIGYLEEHDPEKAAAAKAKIAGRRQESFKEIEEECRQKAGAVVNGTIEEKRRFLEQHKGQYSVLMLCRVLGLDSQYYYYRAPKKKVSLRKKRHDEISRQIESIDREFDHQISLSQIREILKQRGIGCGLPMVKRICKELGILSAGGENQDQLTGQSDHPVTDEVRMQTAKRVLFEGCPPALAAAEVGRSAQSVLLWVRKYEQELREKYPNLPVNDGRGKKVPRPERNSGWLASAARPPRKTNEEVSGLSALFQKPVFGKAARIKAVRAVVVHGLAPEDVAERIGAGPGEVNEWVQTYGSEVLKKPAGNPGHTRRHARIRRSAVYKILFEQYPLEKAAAKLGCSSAHLRRQVLEEYEHLRKTYPQKFERITWQPKPKRAKQIPPEEEAFLREARDLPETDINAKFAFMKEKSGTYTVPMMCRLLGVDESTYEQWNNAPEKNRVIDRDSLVEKVKEANASAGGNAGAQQIWKALGEQGIRCGIGQIYEICKELGIRGSLLPPK